MKSGNVKRGIKGFEDIFDKVRRSVEARARRGGAPVVREDEPPLWHDEAIVRFFKRLGAVPQAWTPQRAALRICIGAGEVSKQQGFVLESVYGVLRLFSDADAGICADAPHCGGCLLAEQCRFVNKRPGVKDLPPGERPRDRLMADGPDHLSDAELLSLVLRDGSAQESALELSKRLLSRFGSFRRLADGTLADLCSVPGIGPARATQIKAALEMARRFATEKLAPGALFGSAADVFHHFHEQMRHLKKESFVLVLLDQKHRVIRTVPISEGSLTQSIVHPREVFRPAIAESAAAVIFVHNHPSGDPAPSRQDRALTDKLRTVADLVGIRVLDHIVIGDGTYLSFAEQGYM